VQRDGKIHLINENGGFIAEYSKNQFTEAYKEADRLNSRIDNNQVIGKQLSIKITPKIKESTSKGIPLFQKNLSEKGITPTVAGFVNQKTGDVYIDKDNPNIVNT